MLEPTPGFQCFPDRVFAQTSLSVAVSDENWNSRVSEAGGLLAMYFWYFDPVGRDLVLSGLEIDLSIADEIMQSSLKDIFNVRVPGRRPL